MSDPVLHVIVGPNGAGKTTFYDRVLGPATHLAFVNTDRIAAERWPGAAAEHAYAAARLAAEDRARRINAGQSFATETVFSHESKIALLVDAGRAGYHVTLHVVVIPEDLAVARVESRVAHGGHTVPEDKTRARFHRLWRQVREAVELVDEARVYDNTTASKPFRLLATYRQGRLTGAPRWPPWTPTDLLDAGR